MNGTMSLGKCFTIVKTIQRYNAVVHIAVRHHWNKDFKPAPFPTTHEARLTAARKYNILPSEYAPYPDDGVSGRGDYPNLPLISDDSKDPNYPYDFPELKRNFQEPIHVEKEMIGEDRYDVSKRHRIPGYLQLLQFLGAVGSLFLLSYALKDAPMFHSLVPKQYPTSEKKHYTFDTNH